MQELEVKDSTLPWLITSATGRHVSTYLPQVVRSFEDYARVDVAIGDNDPVYFAVVQAFQEFSPEWATRFCVAMLAYYHIGTAVQAADREGEDFWEYLAGKYPTAPRGAARRHFRGKAGIVSLQSMRKFAPDPNEFFSLMEDTYLGIKDTCQKRLSGFGPYFWLKIADYMDHCLYLNVIDYYGLSKNLSKVPGQAARTLYPKFSEPDAFDAACESVNRHLILASPHYQRPVGPAEVESCLCDWLHAKDGSNWLGADLETKRQALVGYGPKAELMSGWLPPLVKKGTFTCILK
jgi:hypothetical protein